MASAASTNIVNSYYLAILRFAPSASLAAVYAAQLDSGTLTTTQLQSQLLSAAQGSTVPALITYDLLFNTTPAASGLTYLSGYATALQSGNYSISNSGVLTIGTTPGQFNAVQFSLQNVYVNLGATFASAPGNTFAATYGTGDRASFITQIYSQIFGSGPASSTLTYLLNNFQYYVNYAGSELGGRGAIAGLLASVAETTGAGPYPASANAFLAASAVGTATGSDTTKYGSELVASYGPAASSNIVLTSAVDHVVGNLVTGDLTPFIYSGTGPTLNVGDSITGAGGNSTLTITDQYGTGNDVIPAGVSLNNIQNINLYTQGNAGGGSIGNAGDSAGVFDLTTSTNTTGSIISGVKSVTVLSAGQNFDNVRVDPGSVNAVAVTVNHQHVGGTFGGVTVLGGSTVTVTDGDGKNPNANIDVIGSLSVTGTNGASLNPTGAVSVTETGGNAATVYGGSTVAVASSGGGNITVGDGTGVSTTYPTDEPTGAVTITQTGGVQSGVVNVFGAAPVTTGTTPVFNAETVTLNDTALLANTVNIGAVSGGGNSLSNQAFAPSGAVNVTVAAKTAATYAFGSKTQTGLDPATGLIDTVTVIGGSTVNVTTNATAVVVGGIVTNGSATPLGPNTAVVGENATGAVSVIDTAVDYKEGAGASVAVFGGTNVSVQNAGGTVTVGAVSNGVVFAPTGTETITDTGPLVFDNINDTFARGVTAIGGTTIAITTNAGPVVVGTAAGTAGTEASGTITVVNTASAGPGNQDSTTIFGGTNVTATSANGSITVGAAAKASVPTGNVTTTVAGVETGGIFGSFTAVNGGVNVVAATTGGGVSAGLTTSPITGTVSITDTFAGTQSADAFTVIGGVASATAPAVSLTTTKSKGAINIGNVLPILNAAGTGLSNAASFANGNVAVVNATPAGTGVAGTATLYGTGVTTIGTVGATSVSVIGGGAATITDEQTTVATGGVGAGSAIGKSTLSSVVLDHAEGTSTINTDALTSLTIVDDVGGNAYTVKGAAQPNLALTIGNDAARGKTTTIGVNAGTLTVTDNGTGSAGTVAINSNATAATFTTKGVLNLNLAGSTALTSIGVNNAASLALGTLAGSTAVNVASTATGSVSATIDGSKSSFLSNGSGNATVTLTNGNVTKTVQAGTGTTNTIVANYAGNAATDTPLIQTVRNFNVFGAGVLGTAAGASAASGSFDVTGFSALATGLLAGSVGFTNVAASSSLAVTRDSGAGNTITLNLNKAGMANASTANSLALTLGLDPAAATATTPSSTGTLVGTTGLEIVNTANTANVSIASLGTGGPTGANFFGLADTGASPIALTITGDESLNFLSLTTNGFSSVNASGTTVSSVAGSTSVIDVTGANAGLSGITVVGGAGQIKATGAQGFDTAKAAAYVTQATDTFTSGKGGAIFTLGSGGGFNQFAPVTVTTPGQPPVTYYGVFDTGFEQVNLAASVGITDQVVVGDSSVATFGGKNGGVNNFTVAATTAADQLTFGAGYTVIGNAAAKSTLDLSAGSKGAAQASALDPSGGLANDLANVNFSSSNGVLTVVANGTGTPVPIATSLKLAEIYVSQQAFNLGTGQVALVADGAGNTYVVSAAANNAFTANPYAATTNPNNTTESRPGFSVVELVGVSGLTGFGTTGNVGATGAVITSAQNIVNVKSTGGGAVTTDETGYSRDVVTKTGATFSNFGAAAEVDLQAGAGGTVTTTQGPSAAGNSLFVDAQASVAVNLVASSDWLIDVKAEAGINASMALTDATGTVTTVQATGVAGSSVTLSSVTATALTTIDGSGSSGTLTLGSAVGVNNDKLTILGALGGDTITANGAGDTISVGSLVSKAITGTVNLIAAGAADVVTLTNQKGSFANLSLGGTSDTVSVDNGTNTIGGGAAGSILSRATGAGATVNLADGGNDTAYVGAGSIVNLTGNTLLATTSFGATAGSAATVIVGGDVVGTTSAGFASGATTTASVVSINAADVLGTGTNTGTLGISFMNPQQAGTADLLAGGSTAGAFVNTQGATSLSAAIDLAVNQSLTLEQQGNFGGTSVVNGVVNLAAKTALISWFQYAGNTYVVDAVNNSGAAAARGGAGLAATDSVVRLSGLVDFTQANFKIT